MAPKRSDPPRPTDAELEILAVLWSLGPSTVRAVHDSISRRRAAQYTTVLKLLQIMTEKGLVQRDEKERAHVYRASRPREWTQKLLAGDLLKRAFNNSAKSLLVGALSARKTSKQELAEIRKLLDEYDRGGSESDHRRGGRGAASLPLGRSGSRSDFGDCPTRSWIFRPLAVRPDVCGDAGDVGVVRHDLRRRLVRSRQRAGGS